MADLDRKHYYIDFCGLCGIGLFSFGYIIFYSSFAELNIQFPFLNFPIFVGEILLFICLFLFLVKYTNNPQKFTKWHYLILCYFIFIVIKVLYGYFKWGPLALRHAALLYYPVLAVFGYAFYRRNIFSKKRCRILFSLMLIVFLVKHNEYWTLTLVSLGFILIKFYPKKIIRFVIVMFLVLIPYKDFFQTSRMMILSNFLSGLYLAATLPVIFNVNKRLKLGLAVLIGGAVILGMFKIADHGAVKSIVAFKKMAEVVKTCDAYMEANGEHFKMEEREEVKLYNPNGPARGDTKTSINNDKKTTETTEGQIKAELKKIIVKDVKEKIEGFSLDQVDRKTQREVKQEIESILDMQLPKGMQESSKTLSIKDENQVADVEAVKREIDPIPVVVVQATQEHSVDLVKAEISQVKDEIQESVVGEMKEETGFVLAVPELEAMAKSSIDPVKTDVEAIQGGVRENDVIQTKMQVESDPIVVVPETLKSSEVQKGGVEGEGAKGKIEPVLAVSVPEAMQRPSAEPITTAMAVVQDGVQENAAMQAEVQVESVSVEAVPEISKPSAETREVTPVIAASAPDVIQGPLAAAVEISVPIEEKDQGSDVEEGKAIIRQTIFEQVKQEIRVAPVENMLNGERHQNVSMIDDVKKEMQMAFTEQAKQNVPVVPVGQSNAGWVENNNAVFRILIWRDMWRDFIREKPILGFSFGRPLRSRSLEMLHWGDGDWARDGWIEPHNSYFHIIYRTGIVGILLIFSFLFILFKMIRRFILVKSFTGILLCGIIINWFVAANFLVIFELPYTAIPIWTIYGVTFAYCYKSPEKNKEKTIS